MYQLLGADWPLRKWIQRESGIKGESSFAKEVLSNQEISELGFSS